MSLALRDSPRQETPAVLHRVAIPPPCPTGTVDDGSRLLQRSIPDLAEQQLLQSCPSVLKNRRRLLALATVPRSAARRSPANTPWRFQIIRRVHFPPPRCSA